MENSQKILSSVLKASQMGQIGVRSILNKPMSAEMHQAICQQMKEYNVIENQAENLAHQRGWPAKRLPGMVKTMTGLMADAKLSHHSTDSRIAGMMIQGNTQGMINSLSLLHRDTQQDPHISALSRQLLQTERNNIQQMQSFL